MKNSRALAGNLNFLNLGELFQLLGANSSTGELKIISRYAEESGVVYLKNGSPIDATAGPLTGLDALFSLFGWTEGEFEFIVTKIDRKQQITKSRMEITLEGMKMLDDGLIEKLGPVSFVKQASQLDGKSIQLPLVKGPLVDYMYVADEEDYQPEDTIVKQGRHGNWIWVVLAGTLEVRKETPNGQITVLKQGVGSFIGSIAAFITKGVVRASTVVATSEVQLGVLDSQRLSRENAVLSHHFKTFCKSLDKRNKQCANLIIDLLQKKKNFDSMLKGREPVMRQGDQKDGLYIIEQGNAYVVRETDKGYLPLVRLEEGDVVGQTSFLNFGHEPHSATIFASENFQLKQISSELLQKEFNALSPTMRNLLENTTNTISALTMTAVDLYKKN